MFRKTAEFKSLGFTSLDDTGTLRKTAASPGSYYLDGSAVIDTKGILTKVAHEFDISDNPRDYIYEAIRANTTNVPNDNHDAFTQAELLRYIAELRVPVYRTYEAKPHHVNHRTEDPKRARGVILDAHYNVDSPPLDLCPTKGCGTKTAERRNRDESGIHCRKCGSTVKDEFVEILVAIDTKKDKAFADGVRNGILRTGSMGCTCAATSCKVCTNIARSRTEFCEHIRGANKGTLWERQGANDWVRISTQDAISEFEKRGMVLNPVDFCSQIAPDGFEIRKAYENCLGVEYEEYSRVDIPADRKAEQEEVLKIAQLGSDLHVETEQLIARAKRRGRKKTAMEYTVVRVDGDSGEAYAAQTPEEAVSMAPPNAALESTVIEATDPQDAVLRARSTDQWEPMMGADAGDVTINIDTDKPPGESPVTINEPEDAIDEPPLDSGEGDPAESIEDIADEELMPVDQPGEELEPEELGFGLTPPGASGQGRTMARFSAAYKDWKVQLSPEGWARLINAAGEPLLLFQPESGSKTAKVRQAFGKRISTHLQEHGLFETVEKFDAIFTTKFASVVDYALDDMKEFSDKQTKSDIASGGETDMAGAAQSEPAASTDDNVEDMVDGKSPELDSVQEGRETDLEGASDSASDSALSDRGGDMRDDPRKEKSVGKDRTLDERVVDHKEAAAKKCPPFCKGCDKCEDKDDDDDKSAVLHARLKAVYEAKLAKAIEAQEKLAAEKTAAALESFKLGLRIASRRRLLNMEASPLKLALGDALCNPRVAGRDAMTNEDLEFVPLAEELAMHLIEAAYHDGGPEEMNSLITRATELSGRDAAYLKDAEDEYNKTAHRVPRVSSLSALDPIEAEARMHHEMAAQGNLGLKTAPSADESGTPDGQRHQVRAALNGSTRVNMLTSQLRR